MKRVTLISPPLSPECQAGRPIPIPVPSTLDFHLIHDDVVDHVSELPAPGHYARVDEIIPETAHGYAFFSAGHEPGNEAGDGSKEVLQTFPSFSGHKQVKVVAAVGVLVDTDLISVRMMID